MKRVLVTGANGFVGRACLPRLLERGFEVHAVSRSVPPASAIVQWHHANVKSRAEMQGLLSNLRPTHLLHLAWYTQPGAFWASPENLDWLHCSIELFREFELSGGSRIVATGSCAEYDWTTGLCHEQTTPCRPNTLYGRTKLATATFLEAMSQDNMSTAWARLFFMFGPEASAVRIPGAIISALNRNEPAKYSDGTQERDFLHIDDVARGIVTLVDSAVAGPVNICSGTAIPIREIARQVAELLGKPELLQIGALPTSASEPALIVGDNARLREELGWSPSLTLCQGLSQTIAEWQPRD